MSAARALAACVDWTGGAAGADAPGWCRRRCGAAGVVGGEVALASVVAGGRGEPDAVMGHSLGELAAAHVAGMFSLGDACRLVGSRAGDARAAGGRRWCPWPSRGGAGPVWPVGRGCGGGGERATAVVISGEPGAVLELAEVWRGGAADSAAAGIRMRFTRRAWTRCWRSSPLSPTVSSCRPASRSSPMTGEDCRMGEAVRRVLVRHVREPVRFVDGARWLAGQGSTGLWSLSRTGADRRDGRGAPGRRAGPWRCRMLRRRASRGRRC